MWFILFPVQYDLIILNICHMHLDNFHQIWRWSTYPFPAYSFTVVTLRHAVTLTVDPWPWTCVLCRLSRDQTLYQMLAKLNDLGPSNIAIRHLKIRPSAILDFKAVDINHCAVSGDRPQNQNTTKSKPRTTGAASSCNASQLSHLDIVIVTVLCCAVSGPTLWNSLPLSVRGQSLTLTQFCAPLKTVLFCRAYETLA